jgi:hypothetical protein
MGRGRQDGVPSAGPHPWEAAVKAGYPTPVGTHRTRQSKWAPGVGLHPWGAAVKMEALAFPSINTKLRY